jgi:AcrR family transcriptional regulator
MASPIRLRRKPPRERILAAAGRLFAERGAEAVTMSEVASEAGVARATVFNHFGTKHALIEGITETVLVYYQRLLDGAVADRETPTPDLVRRLFDIMARGIEEQRAYPRRFFREIANITLGLAVGGPGHRARQPHR